MCPRISRICILRYLWQKNLIFRYKMYPIEYRTCRNSSIWLPIGLKFGGSNHRDMWKQPTFYHTKNIAMAHQYTTTVYNSSLLSPIGLQFGGNNHRDMWKQPTFYHTTILRWRISIPQSAKVESVEYDLAETWELPILYWTRKSQRPLDCCNVALHDICHGYWKRTSIIIEKCPRAEKGDMDVVWSDRHKSTRIK